MIEGMRVIAELRERIAGAHLPDKSEVFNTARLEALELDNLLDVAEATAITLKVAVKVGALTHASTIRRGMMRIGYATQCIFRRR